jgi:predicted acyl esterase
MKMDAGVVYPDPVPPDIVLDKNVPVSMRDGIKIAVDVFKRAEVQAPWPTILAYSPFQKERSFKSDKPAFYCPNGYVYIQAAVLMKGNSHFTAHMWLRTATTLLNGLPGSLGATAVWR